MYKAVITFQPVKENLNETFIMLYQVALTFEFVEEIPKSDHSNQNNWVVLSYGAV